MKQDLSQTARALLEGAKVLEDGTWFGLGRDGPSSSNCAVTAINQAWGGVDWITGKEGTLVDDLIRFNDTPGRTKEEVVAKMRELAALY